MDKATRQDRVLEFYFDGWGMHQMAALSGCSYRTILRDFEELNLKCFSQISDDDLLTLIQFILQVTYPDIGRRFINGALLALGHRVQRDRVRNMLTQLGEIRPRPRRLRRLSYHANPGPYFCAHMDQNEFLKAYRIYILSAIDGFCRHCVHFEVLDNLAGTTHTRFFTNMLRKTKIIPAHVNVDMTSCWNAVERFMNVAYADNPGPTPLPIHHRNHEDATIYVERFHAGRSVRNTPVETHWRFINNTLAPYANCFFQLEQEYVLHGGNYPDLVDIFCLHRIFLPYIRHDISFMYQIYYLRRRELRSANPFYPKGTWRPSMLLRFMPSFGTPIDDADIDDFCEFAEAYPWARDPRRDEFPAIPDPLQLNTHRCYREILFEELHPASHHPRYRDLARLSQMYKDLRLITRTILDEI